MSQDRTKHMEGYTCKQWRSYFCKSWGVVRKIQCPEIFTSRKQMGTYANKGVKIRITIEELNEEEYQ